MERTTTGLHTREPASIGSGQRPAAVDRQDGPGGECQTRPRREHGASDFLRVGQPAHWRAAGLLVPPALVEPPHEFGVDEAGRDGDDPYVGRKRASERFGQLSTAALDAQ